MQREPPPALSCPAECQSDHIAAAVDVLDPIHQPMHQKETAAFLACDVLRGWLHALFFHVEIGAFVGDVEDHGVIADDGAYPDVLAHSVGVAAEDGVRQRLRQGHGDVQGAFLRGQMQLATLTCRELDYLFYVFDVAGDLDIERDAGLGHQKLSSARSLVSEIWKSVSSLVSSKSV